MNSEHDAYGKLSHHSYSSSANFDQSLSECTMLKQQLAKRQSMIEFYREEKQRRAERHER